MKLNALRTFTTVARHGNISTAAEELGRTPAAISLTLKQLESELGQPLFLGERKSHLSVLGEFVLEQAGRQVAQFDETVRNIERFAQSETGHLAVASVPSFATRKLPNVIRRFHTRWPNVQIELHEMDSIAVGDALRRREVDFGFVSSDLADAGGELLLQDHFGVVCHRQHELVRSNKPVTWRQLSRSQFIANRLCRVIADPDFQSILDNAKLRVHNTASLLALAESDVGVTVLPGMAMPDNPRDLSFLPLQAGQFTRYIHMLKPEGAAGGSIADSWREFVLADTRTKQ
ncbi:MAG: LysR family transcriptional regulator [Pseudomonadota bacterium]